MGAECSVPLSLPELLGSTTHSQVSARLWGHLAGQQILCCEPFAETRICKARKAASLCGVLAQSLPSGKAGRPGMWRSRQKFMVFRGQVKGLTLSKGEESSFGL